MIKQNKSQKIKKCINYRLLKHNLYSYDYNLINNKAYNKRKYSSLFANYIWNETLNIDLVTKILLKYSKQKIFNIIKNSLNFLIPIYEKEYNLDFNTNDKYRILSFNKTPYYCKHCGKRFFKNNTYCSVLCLNQHKVSDENYIFNLKISLKNYYKRTDDEILKAKNLKIKNTLLEYNKDKEKIILKNNEKWGYDYPQSHPDVINKGKETRLNKYGNENYVNLEQRIETNIIKYGVKSILCNQEWKEHRVYEKYGVKNIMQTGLFTDEYKWKEYPLPSGKIIKYQGYENYLLDELLLEYREDEILTSRADMPEFWYIGLDDKKHRYFPDVYIPKTKTIYEVKSGWTLEKYKDINVLKFQAVKDAGYNFKLKVYK